MLGMSSKQRVLTDYREETKVVVVGVVDRQMKSEAITNSVHHCKLRAFILIER